MESGRRWPRTVKASVRLTVALACVVPALVWLPTPTTPALGSSTSTCRARIEVMTTSDWTSVRLLSGGELEDLTVVSRSPQALFAGLRGDAIALEQALGRSQAGESSSIVVEALLTEIMPGQDLLFEIDRGHIGATRIEIQSTEGVCPGEIAVFTWEGIKPVGRNAQTFDVSSESLIGGLPNEFVVIAQLNFWYYGPGEFGGFEDSRGNRVTPLTPLLGATYRAADPEVVHQQIEWAVEYGVDAFSIEWTTPRGIGCCGSMEDTLDDVFLMSPNVHKIRWTIFYDFVLRLLQTPGLDFDIGQGIDFDRPDVYETFVSDFVHFATKYFDHPQYLRIGGRPVIYVWATNGYTGDLAGAVREARERVSELGFDVFIVGDEVRTDRFDRQHVALFDGATTFTFLIRGIDFDALSDVGDAAAQVDRAFAWWRNRMTGLRVSGRDEFVNFQSAWAPQYDEARFVSENPKYVPALSRDQVVAMAQVARKHAEAVPGSGQKYVWLNTWNNWAETTTVEPTAALGPKYPAGNYQFDMLEVVREVFGRETFFTSPCTAAGFRSAGDRDGDGVPDDVDYCPDFPGRAETNGC